MRALLPFQASPCPLTPPHAPQVLFRKVLDSPPLPLRLTRVLLAQGGVHLLPDNRGTSQCTLPVSDSTAPRAPALLPVRCLRAHACRAAHTCACMLCVPGRLPGVGATCAAVFAPHKHVTCAARPACCGFAHPSGPGGLQCSAHSLTLLWPHSVTHTLTNFHGLCKHSPPFPTTYPRLEHLYSSVCAYLGVHVCKWCV